MPNGIYTAGNRLMPALVLLLALLFTVPAGGEYYYQYTDDNGNVHFTDDPGTVPEGKRSAMKRHRNAPITVPDKNHSAMREHESAFHQRTISDSAWEMNLRREVNSLAQERIALERQFKEIISEKEALGPPPPETASQSEIRQYGEQVEALNRRIDEYEGKRKQFDEKVSGFRTTR